MKTIRPSLRLICSVILTIILLAVIACGGEEQPAAAPTPTPIPTEAPKAAPTEKPATPSDTGARVVPRNRTFIAGYIGEGIADPENMNPYFSQANNKGLDNLLYESLFYMNIFDGKLRPWLASDQPQYNSSFTEVTVKLRPGVTWSDGARFTAQDVVFTVKMVMNNPKMLFSPNLNEWTTDVVAVDDQTVRFTLKKPNPRYILDYFSVHFYNAIRFVPKHIWENAGDPNTFKNYDLAKGLPVATGPYRLVRTSDTQLVWDRRDDWWGAKTGFKELPAPERVIFIPMGTPDRQVALLINNEVDHLETLSAGPYESVIKQNPKIRAFTQQRPYGFVDACPFAVHINNAKKPWNDVVARRSVNYALNKAKFVNLAHEGVTPTSGANSWLEPFLWPAYGDLVKFRDKNSDLYQKYHITEFSPEQANKLLDDAGYKRGADGIRVSPDGTRMTATIKWVPTGYVEFPAPVESLVSDLKAIGVDAAQKQVQWAAWGDIYTGDFDMALIWVCGSTRDPYATLDGFQSKYVTPMGERVQSFSPGRWTGPVADQFGQVVDKIAQVSPEDTPALEPLVRQAMDLWLSELPAVPLFQYPAIKPYNSTYWSGFPTDQNPYNTPYLGWQSGLTVIANVKPTQ